MIFEHASVTTLTVSQCMAILLKDFIEFIEANASAFAARRSLALPPVFSPPFAFIFVFVFDAFDAFDAIAIASRRSSMASAEVDCISASNSIFVSSC